VNTLSVRTAKKQRKKSAVIITTDNLLAETVGFEPTCDCSQTDFEQLSHRLSLSLTIPNFRNF